ncbi:AraC family transcriptional regulator [Aquimarina algicola]|uniref:AraC family transcriptional regulator n=1 Tax=Aquimarina algicola TaxID=2589995 RepID=A0A504IYD5_9FLAO|nr:helix-turn-helix domain-containing protein [Aquimarina algicola]TPN83476.1 AraC family transcriptional regulator [Aquimarina algicola]
MQTILNQLVYFGFLQSLLLLVIYLFSPRKRRHINGYMAFLILTLFIGLAGKVLYSAGVWDQNFRLISLSEISALLFGPTLYLFSRSVLERKSYSHEDLLHYVPALFYCGFVLFYFVLPSDTTISERIVTGELMRAIYTCHAIGLIVNVGYWILSYQIFSTFHKQVQNELSYVLQTRFMVNFLWVVGGCLLIWVTFLIISFIGAEMLERKARPYIWIVLTLIILFITYYSMISPQVLRIAENVVSQKYKQSKLSISDLERLKKELDQLMIDKKPYLNHKLLKAELAEMLGVSNPELARLLNENIGMNFFEYVNYYRVKEFVNLAQSSRAEQLTFFGLAQEAGFNSKTTFNKSFKQLMGTSPSAYFKQHQSLS